jgi:AmiR/NasT family two-component response regulator
MRRAALCSTRVLEMAETALADVLVEMADTLVDDFELDQAFAVLRRASRDRNRRLSELAQAIVNGTATLPTLRG